MSWNSQMDFQYIGNGAPYTTTGSFMDFFEGLTYDHVNFIFSGGSHMQQDIAYSPVSMGYSYYKFGYSEPGSTQYYSNSNSYWVNDNIETFDEYRMPVESSSATSDEETTTVNEQSEGTPNTAAQTSNRDSPRNYHSSHDYQELLELGEAVGTQSRGLSQELISSLPVSKYKCRFFLRKKSRAERCVICQMEYRRGDRLITLPCKHKYHIGCGAKWLSINKACPICYTEVCFDAAKK
ncbi:hypothetical protein Ancab_024691 [Ancistrocladus abbreviatus]